MEGGSDCSSREDFQKLRAFAKAVDESVKEQLKAATAARHVFERRACDFRYAELEDKSSDLIDAYGPAGPMSPGGSYLYALRRWADAAFLLHRACQRGSGGCASLLGYLRTHPEDDLGAGGAHGKAGSRLYTELRMACEVGRTRSPVPNDSPVWCDEDRGLCEQKSCRQWWRDAHQFQMESAGDPVKPWVDDRIEYEDLRDICPFVRDQTPKAVELNDYQRQVQRDADKLHAQYCEPRWVDGYCSIGPTGTAGTHQQRAECNLQNGQHCKDGLVIPRSELDDTAAWDEEFKESPVHVTAAPPLSAPPPLAPRRHGRRRAPAGRSGRLGRFL